MAVEAVFGLRAWVADYGLRADYDRCRMSRSTGLPDYRLISDPRRCMSGWSSACGLQSCKGYCGSFWESSIGVAQDVPEAGMGGCEAPAK
eukprot:12550418-Alexandrium_andersonii.AAC.1